MSKLSHSSDLMKCRCCGDPLDVFVCQADQFCSELCKAVGPMATANNITDRAEYGHDDPWNGNGD